MIQKQFELKHSVQHYNNNVHGDKGGTGQIQKMYSTAHLICLVVRYPGKTHYLYLGRGNNYEGVWEGTRTPPTVLRIRDRYLEYLRKYLTGRRLVEPVVDSKDRILILPYHGRGRISYLLLFFKGRSLYFLNLHYDDNDNPRLFLSWKLLRQNEINMEKLSENEKVERLLAGIERPTLASLGRGNL